jgi:hypothetical protein
MTRANITILFSVCRTKEQKDSQTKVYAILSSMKTNKPPSRSRSRMSWRRRKINTEISSKEWKENGLR